MTAASAHVLVEPRQDCHAVRAALEALLAREHGITHLTLQVDHVSAANDQQADDQQADEDQPEHGEHQSEHDDHTPLHSHCEDSHGPAYRPAQP
jgi:cobalt-zinc-cadmium efflux system protein